MIQRIVLGLLLFLSLYASGCSSPQPIQQSPTANPEKGYVTAFGTIRCAQSLTLAFPFEVSVREVSVAEGQTIAAGAPVLRIDMERLADQKEQMDHRLAAYAAAHEGYALQMAQTQAALGRLHEAVGQMNADKLLNILSKLANAGSRTARDPYEAMLLSYLQKIDSVAQYHELLALTWDRRNVLDNARPAVLQLKDRLTQDLEGQQASLLSLRQSDHQSQADALPLRQKMDIMDDIFDGRQICGVGHFDTDGVLIAAGRQLLLTTAPHGEELCYAAGEPVAVFGALDTLEIQIPIEEQLITGVSLGSDVQLSPLYDKSVVWLGTVKAISGQAVVLNGETVIPVTAIAEGLTLGPGYNLVAKIYPSKD